MLNTHIGVNLEAYSRQFFYLKYATKDLSTATWNSTTTGTNTNTGYKNRPLVVGEYQQVI